MITRHPDLATSIQCRRPPRRRPILGAGSGAARRYRMVRSASATPQPPRDRALPAVACRVVLWTLDGPSPACRALAPRAGALSARAT